MNAAILDDIASDCEMLRSLLNQHEAKQQTMQIKEFHSGRELLSHYIMDNIPNRVLLVGEEIEFFGRRRHG